MWYQFLNGLYTLKTDENSFLKSGQFSKFFEIDNLYIFLKYDFVYILMMVCYSYTSMFSQYDFLVPTWSRRGQSRNAQDNIMPLRYFNRIKNKTNTLNIEKLSSHFKSCKSMSQMALR